MQYPCIVYARDYVKKQHADNGPYKSQKRYQVTVIDRDPDSTLPDLVGELPSCNYERFFTAENLNHDIFKLFY